jgi:Flp pilus assembly pilin Flp
MARRTRPRDKKNELRPRSLLLPNGLEREGGELKMKLTRWFDSFRGRWSREEGQTMAEYAVVLGAVAVTCVVAFTSFSGAVSNAINAAAKMFG